VLRWFGVFVISDGVVACLLKMGGNQQMKYYCIVAGIDYPSSSGKYGTKLLKYARDRVTFLHKKQKGKEEATFVIFDFLTGNKIVYESRLVRSVRTLSKPKTYSMKDAVSYSKNYPTCKAQKIRRFYVLKGKSYYSILDVYREIEAAGRDPVMAGKLEEFSIFSHAYIEGPVLMNSDEWLRYNPATGMCSDLDAAKRVTVRDPRDHDGRPSDFTSGSVINLADFKKAFSPTGICWNWGCFASDLPFQLIIKLTAAKNFKLSGMSDAEKITLWFSSSELKKWQTDYDEDGYVVPQKKVKFVTKTFKEIKEIYQDFLDSSYTQAMAKATGRPTYGAAPGTGSSFTPRVQVSTGSRHTRNLLKFYKNYFSLDTDPEGKNYLKYL